MLGAIVGDIIGSPYEFESDKTKDFELFIPACRPTDDSVLTVAVGLTCVEAGNADESEAENTAADIDNAESEQQEINTPAEAIAETVSETAVETEDKTETAEPEQNTENPQTETEEIEQEKTLQAETPPPQEEKIKPVMPVFDTPPVLSERAKEILKRSRKKRKDGDDDDNDILQPELFL